MKNAPGRSTIIISPATVERADRVLKRIRGLGFKSNRAEAVRVAIAMVHDTAWHDDVIKEALAAVRMETVPRHTSPKKAKARR